MANYGEFVSFTPEQIDLDNARHVSTYTGNVTFERPLLNDPDTGMLIKQVRYPKGTYTGRHTHGCGHGLYVLRGTLYTDKGDFGPGSFVWFPQGQEMEHGGKNEEVECLLISNKPFDMNYLNG